VGKQGSRTDLNGFRERAKLARSYGDLYDDAESLEVLAKYPRFARSVYDRTRPAPPQLELELRPWQNRLVTLLDEAVLKRRIIWVWSAASNLGKSTMKEYFYTRKKLLVINATTLDNIMYAYDEHEIIWWDVARSTPLNASFSSILETLSDGGIVPSNKYECSNKYVKAHIVVSSNRAPIFTRLPDRIVEVHIPEPEVPLVAYDPINNAPVGGWQDAEQID